MPPSFSLPLLSEPSHTITSEPVQTAECCARMAGAPADETDDQTSCAGSYRAPTGCGVPELVPPQMTMWLPVQVAVCSLRASGAPVGLVGAHVSVPGS